MTDMFLVSGSWLARGDGVMLDGHGLRSTLDDLNARMVEAEGLLESATNMCGVGFVDQLTRNDEVSTGMVLLESFVAGFPYEVKRELDEPLCQAFNTGPTRAVGGIRVEDFVTVNRAMDGRALVDSGFIAPGVNQSDPLMDYSLKGVPGMVGFADFVGGCDRGVLVPGFDQVFRESFQYWQAQGGSDINLGVYLDGLLASGEFDHRGYHPGLDFVSAVLDATGVWAFYKAIVGHDPITGEDLSTVERWFEGVVGVVALASFGLGGWAVRGSAYTVGIAIARVMVVDALATGGSLAVYDTAAWLGAPSWVCVALALGTGLVIAPAAAGRFALYRGGKMVGEPFYLSPVTSVGYPVDRVIVGRPGLWKQDPMPRGNEIDVLAGNNTGHNFHTFDKFDAATGQATSIKSLDTSKASYQTKNGLYSKLNSYLNGLDKFPGDKLPNGMWVYPNHVRSQVLEIAIPDRRLTPAQIEAFDAIKSTAAQKNVTIVITVVT